MTTIHGLIDKEDTFELVRDKIAQILADETASQQALATAASKDPALWKFRVYRERANAWETWLNTKDHPSPIVNVSFDRSEYDPSRGNIALSQVSDSTYFLDIYAVGETKSDGAGHVPGDRDAALNAHAAYRLVRNILMNVKYKYLDMRKIVTRRWPASVETFKVRADKQVIKHVAGIRVALSVDFLETVAGSDESNTLEYISIEIKEADDESVIAQVDYDYTTMPPYE